MRLDAVSHASDTHWRRHATTVVVAGTVLAAAMAGCSSQPAVTVGTTNSCFEFALSAIQRHVTVTSVPAACQGLSPLDVNVAVGRALRAATAGARGKVAQREAIGRDTPYVLGLIRAVPAASPPAAPASQSRPPSRAALNLAALIVWLVTVGLGLSMMARWITRTRRHGTQPRRGRGPLLNFTHFGLALTSLLIWISYLATGVVGLAWAACGLLLAVAGLGISLVFLAPAATAAAPLEDDPPRVGRPPVPVIAAHITAACVTILLATLAAIGSG